METFDAVAFLDGLFEPATAGDMVAAPEQRIDDAARPDTMAVDTSPEPFKSHVFDMTSGTVRYLDAAELAELLQPHRDPDVLTVESWDELQKPGDPCPRCWSEWNASGGDGDLYRPREPSNT